MKKLWKWMLAVTFLAGFTAHGKAAEIFKNDDLDLSFGGRIQVMGDAELESDDYIRSHFRLYLWDEEDRLFTSGSYQGYSWNFEVAFGGEAINSSNNQLNLLDASIDVPVIQDMITAKFGQFKVPGNLESAIYEGNQLFSEKDPMFNLFFNQGYDTGAALYGHLGDLDGQFGLVQGGPDVVQRYLPEILNFPTPMFLRVGINEGIKDDPFHPKQTGFDKPDKLEWAAHLTGYIAADSNAGHSDDLGLGGGYLSTFNANSQYGNVLISSVFNPYLGAAGANPVTANYWQWGADAQVRAPLSDTTFTLTGQVMFAHYDMTVGQAVPYETQTTSLAGQAVTIGQKEAINIGGGEVIASVGDKPWEVAGRFAVVVPDDNMIGTYTYRTPNGKGVTVGGVAVTSYAPIFVNSNPIYDLTLPSITLHVNNDVKVVAETMWMFDTVEVHSDDGMYLVAEMPGSANSGINSANTRIGFVPVGRMQLQLQF
jgi:hypothetical protein